MFMYVSSYVCVDIYMYVYIHMYVYVCTYVLFSYLNFIIGAPFIVWSLEAVQQMGCHVARLCCSSFSLGLTTLHRRAYLDSRQLGAPYQQYIPAEDGLGWAGLAVGSTVIPSTTAIPKRGMK